MRKIATLAFALYSSALFAAGVEVSPPGRASHPTAAFAAVASNGNGFLTTWRDSSGAIDGATLDRSGNRISPDAFRILGFVNALRADYLAPLGSGYALAWTDTADVARLSILETSGALIRTVTPAVPPGSYSLSSDGNNLLLYTTVGGNFAAYLVDADGRVRQIDAVLGGVTKLDATAGSGEILIAAAAASGVHLIRVAPALSQDTVTLIEATGTFTAISAVATASGNDVLMAWSVSTSPSAPVVTRTGVVDRAGRLTRSTTLPYYGFPYVAPAKLLPATGHHLLVLEVGKNDGSASDYLNIAGLRLDSSGQSLDAQPFAISTSGARRRVEGVARSGDTFTLVTTEELEGGQQVLGVFFRSDATVRDVRSEVLSVTRAFQTDVDIATDRFDFLSVWKETTAENQAIKARRIDRSRQPQGETLTLSRAGTRPGPPQMASGAGVYLVVWSDGSEILGSRVSWFGTRLDASPFVIRRADAVGTPAITWNGQTFLVIWSESSRIFGTHVTAAGTIEPARPVSPPAQAGMVQIEPAVVWDGIQYLAAWTLIPVPGSASPAPSQVRGILLSRELVPVALSDSLLFTGGMSPELARGPTDVLLLVRRGDGSLAALFIESSGVPQVRATVIVEDGFTAGARAFWTGFDYVIAYSTLTNNFSTRSFKLTHLTRTSAPRTRSTSMAVEGAPAIAVNLAGDLVLLLSEFRSEGTLPPTPRAIVYSEAELERPAARRRAAGR